jgi:subtilisin family serine protease
LRAVGQPPGARREFIERTKVLVCRVSKYAMSITLRRSTRPFTAISSSLLLLGSLSVSVGCGSEEEVAESTGQASSQLGLRQAPDKTRAAAFVPSDLAGASIVVKFHEGTGVRLRGDVLEVEQAQTSELATKGLDVAAVKDALPRVSAELRGRGATLKPFVKLPRATLAKLKQHGERRGGRRLADLSLYFEAQITTQTAGEVTDLVEALNALDSVEIAYLQPKPEPMIAPEADSVALAASSTPDFTGLQGYTEANSNGIGVPAARALPGGRGEHVRIIDIETRWTDDHEDLPAPFFYLESRTAGDESHGTSVAGVMVGLENGYGVTGIAPLAGIGYASHNAGGGVEGALEASIAQLGPGDVLLLEMHFGGGPATASCTCNQGQCNYVPTEYYPAYFDLIQTATANGIVVVEAAGNGSVNLDDPSYGGIFDRNVRDSGAIMVGAGSSSARTPMCWTNYGQRIDVHGWGENVVTAGGGNLYAGPLGVRDVYTQSFSGTSSASPIVAGAAAVLESIAQAETDEPLSPQAVRELLASTGTPQSGDFSRRIGPLPNLVEAVTLIGNPAECGNGTCEAGETCTSCAGDCGTCQPQCGNGTCEAGETCASCAGDCGTCQPQCGNGICEAGETCASCASDCGACQSECVPDGCEGSSTVTIPFVADGASNRCVFFAGQANYISSWNMSAVELNGASVANSWVASSSFPQQCDGGYYLRVTGSFAWSHVEVK